VATNVAVINAKAIKHAIAEYLTIVLEENSDALALTLGSIA